MVETVELKTNYWDLYPRREAITLQSVEKLKEAVGIRIILKAHMTGFSHFVYSFDNEPPRESRDGRIEIRFEDSHAPKSQSSTLKVKSVSKIGEESRTYMMAVGYYPRELYAARGHTSPGWAIIKETDIHLKKGCVKDWIPEDVTKQERSYARRKWGPLIANATSDYEAAKSLAKAIIDDLEPHRGTPSDEMAKLSPLQQYERVLAGKDKVWCGNIAAIFSYACNALGMHCRRIGMHYHWPPKKGGDEGESEGYRILLAEGHSTTEVFSESLNQWVWMDPTFRILGAHLEGLSPINMAEIHLYLNEPNRAKSLRLLEYDPTGKKEKVVPLDESKYRNSLLVYFKRDQIFRYLRRTS